MYKDNWYKVNKNINLSIPIVERKNVYSEINNVINFLNKFKSCNYFFSCGTALGLVREGRLLDWDTDVDIDILEPTELIINNIIDNMQALGYSYQRVLKSKRRYSQIVFIKAPYHSIDFCFCGIAGLQPIPGIPRNPGIPGSGVNNHYSGPPFYARMT